MKQLIKWETNWDYERGFRDAFSHSSGHYTVAEDFLTLLMYDHDDTTPEVSDNIAGFTDLIKRKMRASCVPPRAYYRQQNSRRKCSRPQVTPRRILSSSPSSCITGKREKC